MQDSILYIVLALLCFVIYLLVNQKKQKDEDKGKEEINKLKESLNQSFGQMSKDMVGALTRVDEKVATFNKQVEDINKSQENFSRILAGVKQYGGLAEFSLASLLKDLFTNNLDNPLI